ncbi:voltage-dependent calcium channel gamma-5 subunit-like [Saccoglossus kowalevskii]|uniref:Voltage-dependent calcium channel gamma-5 subunit-like n=1 Tax=Saccoglossus kowalevskii TaxID=10224 RepID=A0ABM0M7X2_SACKO|nr:PREDICTED: voltage-dependent calcium channel gamma-5 subunit-like [Saccoglossus kowalevskii]
MPSCSERMLVISTTAGYVACLCLLSTGVATSHWLYSVERSEYSTFNGTTMVVEVTMHSGLWRLCPLSGENVGDCRIIEYFTPNPEITSDTTTAVARLIRSSAAFPCVSLLLMIVGTALGVASQKRPEQKHLVFVAGIVFVTSGLSLFVGIIIYISSINDALSDQPTSNGHRYTYYYGYSFVLVTASFGLSEVCGVMCMYLYIRRYMNQEENESRRKSRLRRYNVGNIEENEVANRLVYRCPEVMIPA